MKASKTLIESLEDMGEVTGAGDLRRIVANSMLALVRKEISATDLTALADGLGAISDNMNAECKVAKTSVELREKGANLGNVVAFGQLVIGQEKP